VHIYDVLRGLAIFGTFAVNIWVFAVSDYVTAAFDTALTQGVLDPVSRFMHAAQAFLLSGKFLAMLAIVFGMGMQLLYQRALARGEAWPAGHHRRALALLLIGAVHFVFVFQADVLMTYAVVALIAAPLLARPPGVQRTWFLIALALHVLLALAVAVYNAQYYAAGPAPQPQDDPALAGFVTEPGPWGYLDDLQWRLQHVLHFRAEAIGIIPGTLALVLVGAWLVRTGVLLTPSANPALRERLFRLGLQIGLPSSALLFLPWPSHWLVSVSLVVRYLSAPILTIGIMAAVSILIQRRLDRPATANPTGAPTGPPTGPGFIETACANVGRCALTCYLAQNILGLLLFMPYLGNLQDRLPSLAVYCVLLAVWVALAAIAHFSLTRWKQGPLEALWRAAAAPSSHPTPTPPPPQA
jgi:uncharacterized protein